MPNHFTSRFRRAKKEPAAREESPALSAADDRVNPSPTAAATAVTTSAGRQDTPPALSITTTTTTTSSSRSTTPPRSSHNTLQPPKSPFRGFHHHFRSAKRARSPAPASLPVPTSPAIVNHDGTVEQEAMPRDQPNGQETADTSAKMPSFLNLSEQEIEVKFQDMTWLERLRMNQSVLDPSPTPQFARVTDPENKILDRYANIQPWANNRVKLQVPEGQRDYINASPIELPSFVKPSELEPRRYIAMQGPKLNTVEHAWRMIAEQLQSPAVIVMLTDTHESGQEKCALYFPRTPQDAPVEIGQEEDEFGDGFRACVKCISVEERGDGSIEMRKLNIHVQDPKRDIVVWHLLYKRWPDFGVPAVDDVESFLDLMQLSRELNAKQGNPRIIHCSAGVGRSGTFMALEHLMREVEHGDLEAYEREYKQTHAGEEDDSKGDIIFETVNTLRKQRKQMVQSEPQYSFIYKVIRKLYMEKHGIVDDVGPEPASKRLEVNHDPFISD